MAHQPLITWQITDEGGSGFHKIASELARCLQFSTVVITLINEEKLSEVRGSHLFGAEILCMRLLGFETSHDKEDIVPSNPATHRQPWRVSHP